MSVGETSGTLGYLMFLCVAGFFVRGTCIVSLVMFAIEGLSNKTRDPLYSKEYFGRIKYQWSLGGVRSCPYLMALEKYC